MTEVRYTDVPPAWATLREGVPSVDERAAMLRISRRLVRAADSGRVRAGALPQARVRRAVASIDR